MSQNSCVSAVRVPFTGVEKEAQSRGHQGCKTGLSCSVLWPSGHRDTRASPESLDPAAGQVPIISQPNRGLEGGASHSGPSTGGRVWDAMSKVLMHCVQAVVLCSCHIDLF
jgi:hypothetical protein